MSRPIRADALAAAAEGLVGAPFRLHGRDGRRGVDCIGLLACALDACGTVPRLPNLYHLHNRTLPDLAPLAAAHGFVRGEPPFVAGDVTLVQVAPCQVHLLIAARGGGFVHAHAGLGRVVISPSLADWAVLEIWRLPAP